MSQNYSSSRGASLVEVVTSVILSLVVVMAAATLFRPAMDLSFLLTQQAGAQQGARLAVNVLTSDLALAGNGLSGGGIQLPDGAGSVDAKFACDAGGCYVTSNLFTNSRLYSVTPGNGKGPTVNTVATDSITIAYRDSTSNFDQLPLTSVNANGDEIYFDAATSPAWDDASSGVKVGDVLVLCNTNGCAAGEVNRIHTDHVHMLKDEVGYLDNLEFNQPAAAFGNVKSIMTPAAATRAYRISVITYYIDNSNPDVPRLMKQVNAHTPGVASLYVENLQFSYDIFDENAATTTNNLPDAGGNPNQIRKINLSIGARSPSKTPEGGFEHVVLTTSISTRNLRFRDAY
ncbi:MAG: hypothetical protein V3T35_07665 [Spirochaetia bacterium]